MNTFNPGGAIPPTGTVRRQVVRDHGELHAATPSWRWRLQQYLELRRSVGQIAKLHIGRVLGLMTLDARLHGVVYRPDWSRLAPEQILKLKALLTENVDVRRLPALFGGQAIDHGLLSARLVTDNGVGYIVDAFQNLVELENMKFHGYGTGTNAEAQGDSALQTELTTEYAVDSTRPTGTTTEGASANIYRTVATLSPDSGGTLAITEHGIFSASSAGVLLDRSKFAAINLVAGSDSLQTTYDLTLTAGG